MPTLLDSSQFEEVPNNSTAGPKPLDSSQFEALPIYANGSSSLTPINKSPLDDTEKAKLSLGNEKGNIQYLASKFEEIKKNKDGELLVKDQGLWHRLDPKTFDAPDAWEASKIIAKKLPSMTGTAMQIGGAMVGGALGSTLGPAGTIAGAGLGAAAAEGIRTSLGRAQGTYEATPEQQVKDIAWEGLLASGGETVALGLKPALPMVRKAMENINDWGTNFAKESMASIWGTLTDAGKWGARRAMDNPAVIGEADAIVKTLGNKVSREGGEKIASNIQNKLITSVAEDSKIALQKDYGRNLAQVIKDVPDSFSADAGQIFKNVQQKMVDSGYGFLDKSGQLKIFTDAQVAEKLGTSSDIVPKIIGENTRSAMDNVARVVNQYSRYPTLEGKAGAKKLVDLKRSVGESFNEFFQDNVPDSIQRSVIGVKQEVENGIAQQFANHNVGPQYLKMNSDYAAKKDTVDFFNKAIDKGQADQLVKKLVSKQSTYGQLQDEAKTMAQLLGNDGAKRLERVMDLEAAKGFVSFNPKTLGGNTGVTAAKIATLGTQSNPRVVAKQIQYGQKGLDFLRSLPPQKIKQFLGNDDAVRSMITPLVQASTGEEQQTEQLLNKAGVK